jgi:hypothetical protein
MLQKWNFVSALFPLRGARRTSSRYCVSGWQGANPRIFHQRSVAVRIKLRSERSLPNAAWGRVTAGHRTVSDWISQIFVSRPEVMRYLPSGVN